MAKQKDDSSWCVGFEYEFADPASRDYECPLCLHVMREPMVTDCCGGHFCSSCILTVSGSGKGCPLCRRRTFKTLINKAVERKIADLRICCPTKDRGCPWQGPARDAAAHLARETGDCGFVPVDCPAKCGQEALRSHIPVHLRDHCPKREVVCPHCRHGAPADQMLAEHWMACPNGCTRENASVRFERCRLEFHLSECPNQLVACDFRDLGCDERIRRQDSFEHNTSKHLVMLYTLMLNMKKRLDAKDATIRQLEESLSTLGRERERIETELKVKCAEMVALKEKVTAERPENHVSVLNPSLLVHVMSRFAVYKTTQEWWEGPEFYTHHEGYRLRLCAQIRPELDSEHKSSSYVCVRVDILEGRYDKELKWDRGFEVALSLLNQQADNHHFMKTLRGVLLRFQGGGVEGNTLIEDSRFALCDERTEEVSIQFVRDDCIKFRICSVEFL
eukprot:Em0003g910a